MPVIFQVGGLVAVATRINPSLLGQAQTGTGAIAGVAALGLIGSPSALTVAVSPALYPVPLYNNITDVNVTLTDPLLGSSIAASFVTDTRISLLYEIDLVLIR